ncbi:MAG: ELWxxDGT repeat protein, partial [Verrucomicrobiales bacterium]
GGLLYYSGVAGADFELWRTDGTPGGTVSVLDIASGGPEDPRDFVVAGSRLFFVARTTSTSTELWVSDGTAGGTHITRNIAGFNGSFEESSVPENLTPLGDRVVFTAWNRALRRELWISDGTLAGTVNLIDLFPGPLGGLYRDFVVVGSEIYFTANDGVHGRELWKTDGTPGGTVLVEDLVPGAGSGNPESLSFDGTNLWYVADSGADDLSLRCLGPGADPYETWLDRVSTLSGPDRDPSADPNNNTRVNLFEYGTGGDPDSPGLVSPAVGLAARGGDLVFAFPRWRDWEHRGLGYTLEFSTDLELWIPVDLALADIRILTGDFELVEFVIDAAAAGADPAEYYRLRISGP